VSAGELTVEGRPVRVRIEGPAEGVPLVLIHGIGRSLEDWSEQFPLLSTTHRVIALDLPGFGYSARRAEPATLAALARGVLATLDELGEQRPVHLVGNSLGGAVSLQTLALAPNRVASVVLVNSAGFGAEVTYILRMLAIPVLGKAMLYRPTRSGLAHAERALYADRALATQERVAHALRLGRQPGAAAFMDELMHNLGTFRGGVRPQWRADLLAAVAAHPRPMLIVWGDRDRILPPSQFEAARAVFPDAQTHLFPNTGHMPHLERPTELAALISEFVAAVPSGRDG
jgi:pimeloyl-ACP methyl ester carboxylesterase